jgi:hypothetical protein
LRRVRPTLRFMSWRGPRRGIGWRSPLIREGFMSGLGRDGQENFCLQFFQQVMLWRRQRRIGLWRVSQPVEIAQAPHTASRIWLLPGFLHVGMHEDVTLGCEAFPTFSSTLSGHSACLFGGEESALRPSFRHPSLGKFTRRRLMSVVNVEPPTIYKSIIKLLHHRSKISQGAQLTARDGAWHFAGAAQNPSEIPFWWRIQGLLFLWKYQTR